MDIDSPIKENPSEILNKEKESKISNEILNSGQSEPERVNKTAKKVSLTSQPVILSNEKVDNPMSDISGRLKVPIIDSTIRVACRATFDDLYRMLQFITHLFVVCFKINKFHR